VYYFLSLSPFLDGESFGRSIVNAEVTKITETRKFLRGLHGLRGCADSGTRIIGVIRGQSLTPFAAFALFCGQPLLGKKPTQAGV
jgi:hypothetical protein